MVSDNSATNEQRKISNSYFASNNSNPITLNEVYGWAVIQGCYLIAVAFDSVLVQPQI
jgi:hypothetical protein